MIDIEHVREAAKKLQDAMNMLSRGPSGFYLEELVAAHDLLMGRFAPFKVGDRVRLLKAPDLKPVSACQQHGWWHCRHFLVPGAAGVVREAECGSKGFRFGVVFDSESWIDDVGHMRPKGSIVPIESDDRHIFTFGEGWLEHESPNDRANSPATAPGGNDER
jgi:hypothetical protein